MEKIYERLLIFDGSHALHRSICEPHLWEMRNLEGHRTGGVYGTLQTISKECKQYNYFPVVVFDGHLSQRRLEIYPNYKRHQDKQLLQEDISQLTDMERLQATQRIEYNTQREILKELLPAFGIPVIHLTDWEGDDIIYILSRLTKDSVIVSDDKDMLQLVVDEPEWRCRIKRGMLEEFVTLNTLQEFIARKALIGDPSDNIPSACFQVGEKTALGLYKLYMESRKTGTEFPKDEKELDTKCKALGISKRKAYLNFNEEQFLENMLLMDLSLVEKEVTPELINEINEIIMTQSGKTDVSTIEGILAELGIRNFISTNLVDIIKERLDTIQRNDNINFRSIIEKNTSVANKPTKTLF
jgi:5'-3' exonuclease